VLAAERKPSHEEIQRVQRLVSAEIARTSRLVDDMLLLAGSEHRDFLRLRTVELRQFLEDLWSTTTAGHDRRFELGRIPDGTLECDPDRLAQALRNLIDNALSHTEARTGSVSLDTSVLPDGAVRFTVSDDGPGIPEEQRERIARRSALRRLVDVDDVAAAVEYLLSDGARNITGTVITVDAGNTA